VKPLNNRLMPNPRICYRALVERDSRFEGVFFAAVRTTGVFCRPTCHARKPKRENVEFYASTSQALQHGYRPCKLCQPMRPLGKTPDWLEPLLDEVRDHPTLRFKDQDLRDRGLDPLRVRRWFQKIHGITFHAFCRMNRLSQAFGQLRGGKSVGPTAFSSGYESLSGFTDSFKKSTGFAPSRSPHRTIIHIHRLLSPLGPLLAGATEKGICLLEFADRRMLETQLSRLRVRLNAEILPGHSPFFEPLQTQLDEYFDENRKDFDVPLVLAGTNFQERAWNSLRTIPCGETRSYQQQAESIGQPSAVRAVARANGDNRIAILIPCHRVIGKNGRLTGYGGGLWRKRSLLELEGASFCDS
jgi:AraC family transcriptional regulator, regulatory protein of adaptative response / methylated-DNA-[protein]-cysteine methyltransferase